MKCTVLLFNLISSLLLLSACENSLTTSTAQKKEIRARNEINSLDKPIVYQMKVPQPWLVVEPEIVDSLNDTTKPLIEFFIKKDSEQVHITVYNFPVDDMQARIPAMAQISRWKNQFTQIDPVSVKIKPQSFGGYQGFCFEACGSLQNQQNMAMLGWVMQLNPEHFRNLSRPVSKSLEKRFRQMRGDVTVKAVGNEALLKSQTQEIINFVRSFQLIDDIDHSL